MVTVVRTPTPFCVKVSRPLGDLEKINFSVDGNNQRTISCKPGFYAVAPTTHTITLPGNTTFGGCFGKHFFFWILEVSAIFVFYKFERICMRKNISFNFLFEFQF